MSEQTLPTSSNRIGFHYFQDQNHYREFDLSEWLPRLQSLNASWLVLQATPNRAVPEAFLRGLLSSGIQPVIFSPMDLQQPPVLEEIKPLFTAYAHWGARYIILADQPNNRAAWNTSAWVQEDLVERFLDRYLPAANLALQEGLQPVLPPLTPGGSYWDTAFLRSLLESLQRRRQVEQLDHLILSAYAWTHDRHLNWGAGGPERWPAAKPYQPTPDEEDQLGYRNFDWVQTVARAVTGKETPTLLLQAGAKGVTSSSAAAVETSLVQQELLKNLLGLPAVDPADSDIRLDPLPESIIACNFWLLAEEAGGEFASDAWFESQGEPLPAAHLCQNITTRPAGAAAATAADETPAWMRQEFYDKGEKPIQRRPIQHYLLLPVQEWGIAEWHLEVIKPFVRKHKTTIGFSLKEAVLASKVTVIGSEDVFPEKVLNQLRSTGCQVERIQGDGTTIATILAER
ncbi:MAG: hypothetical protein GYA48_04070 [Chloroflexi bacterium]|nr:hypothetical protein [Chloroflexota bacterium]